jgi:tRNA pseudouridine55 synthase
MEGIIIINKPSGWTSFDVVKKIRRMLGVKKVGHSGTLDPMATGVLPIFLGSATKCVSSFMNGTKGYVGEMTIGVKTDTLDADGKVIGVKENLTPIAPEQLVKIFQMFTGDIKQVPPMASAIHYKGKRLYQLARQGKVVPRPEREVTIHELKLIGIENDCFPKVKFYCKCSKGTYVRSLAHDIGEALKLGAHLSALKRVYSHPFTLEQALTISSVEEHAKNRNVRDIILDHNNVLEGLN